MNTILTPTLSSVRKGKLACLTSEALLVIACSLFVALSAQIAIPLFFTPVPVSMQTFAIFLVGGFLGKNRAAICLITYLFEASCGLPFFAGGLGGVQFLVGPTGGYLLGFVAAAYVIGWFSEKGWTKHFGTAFLAIFIGNAALYSLGLLWLSRFVGTEHLLTFGLYPFVIGAVLKMLLGAGIFSRRH